MTSMGDDEIAGHVKAAVAYYPSRYIMAHARFPLLILLGDRDHETIYDNTPTSCAKSVQQNKASHQIRLSVLENATHGFDYYYDAVPWKGGVLDRNEKATEDALKQTRKFLEQHLN